MRAGHWKPARLMLAGSVAALLGVQAVRVAAIDGLGGDRLGERLWPGHPSRIAARALTQIGAAAGRGQPPPPAAIAAIEAVATRDPLSPDPWLVAGTAAIADGRVARGETLLRTALALDPRNLAARFLLAQQGFARGDLASGIADTRVLARFVPAGLAPLAPALAAYANRPDGIATLRPLLAADPVLQGQVLEQLAADPDATAILLNLAPAATPPGGRTPRWQTLLLDRQVAAGRIAEAHGLWLRFNGVTPARPGLVDPDFTQPQLPPPFGWTLASSAAGSAERGRSGGLQLLSYGRAEAILASQTLTLPPGRYRLTLTVAGAGEGLRIRIACLGQPQPLADLALSGDGSGDRALTAPVVIPAACPAQAFAFVGTAIDSPHTIAVTVRHLRLEADPG